MKKISFEELFEFLPKSKRQAGVGLAYGLYPFYTSSNNLTKFIDEFDYSGNCLIFGTGGSPSVHYQAGKFSTSTDCIVACPKNNYDVNTKYSYLFFRSNMNILEAGFKGAGLKHISKGYISNIAVPLPTLDDQIRIATILTRVQALIAKRKESIKELDELLKSTFLELFGDPVRNEKKWEKKRIDEIADTRLGKMRDKQFITGKNLKYYLGNSNVRWFSFDFDKLEQMDFDEDEQVKFSLQYGDLLICEGGEIGRCAIWKCEKEDLYFQKALHRVRVYKETVYQDYLAYVLYWYSLVNGFKNVANKATIAHLTGEKLKETLVPIPPLPLQNQFAAIVEKVEIVKAKYIQSLSKLEKLYGSLSQQAFKGELDLSRVSVKNKTE